jgi:hypothetical protein
MHRSFVVLIAAALAVVCPACSSAHRSTEVLPGIYHLSIRGEVDACSPARETGAMGEVGVVVAPGVLNVPVPDATEVDALRVSLSRTDGWHGESSATLAGCVGATLDRSWTVLDTDDGSFEVAYRESWRGLDGCGEAMRSIMPEAPTGDCDADLVLDYQLREACMAPCEVGVSVLGVACVCD